MSALPDIPPPSVSGITAADIAAPAQFQRIANYKPAGDPPAAKMQ